MTDPLFRIVNVDSLGHRVYPQQGEPWDRSLARAVELVARASYALSKELGRPIGTVKIDWPDGATAIVRVGDGSVTGIIIEPQQPAPSGPGQHGLAGAEA